MPGWLIPLIIGLLVGGVVVYFLFESVRKKALRARDQVRARLGPENIQAEFPSANCLGEESRGRRQVRGNGCLALTAETIHFQYWVGGRTIEIPLSRVTGTSIEKSFLGKTMGYPLVVITYTGADGAPDRCAYLVRKPAELRQKIDELRQGLQT